MKKLIVLLVLVAFAGMAVAELYTTPTYNADFASGDAGWGTWGSGSGSGPSGYAWKSHWAYIETTGGVGGVGDQFMALTTANQAGYSEWWGWGYDVTWRDPDSTEELDWTSTPGVGTVKISGWFKDMNGTGAEGGVTFEWVDFSGGDEGGGRTWAHLIPREGVSFNITTDWAYYETTLPVPAGAYGVRPVWGLNNAGKLMGLDQVLAVYIPEPMSIALLGLGGLFLRRKK